MSSFNPSALLATLHRHGVEHIVVGPGHQLLDSAFGPIDFLGAIGESLDFEALLPRSVVLDLGGFTARVLTLDAVIELKRRAGRPKDLAVLPVLESSLRRIR